MHNSAQWNWFFWGKHPGVPDFVAAGTATPLFQRFTQWVDTGFAKVDPDLKKKSRHCSWRFWAKGTSGDVVCGLVRNSCDSYGRSFPLLCIGAGRLSNWARNCSLLPFAFESIWKQFEYIAAARYDTIKALDDASQLVKPPEPLWRDYQVRIYSQADLYRQSSYDFRVIGNNSLCEIDCREAEDLPKDLCFCSNMLASTGNGTPTAVFIGELGHRLAVAMVGNMLKPSDFVWLWSMQPGDGRHA